MQTNAMYEYTWQIITNLPVYDPVPAGDYQITASAPGYYNFNGTLKVVNGQRNDYHMNMVPISDGLTISYSSASVNFLPNLYWNITVPSGYSKIRDGISSISTNFGSSDMGTNIFGSGNPSPLIEFKDQIIRLKNPITGTYQFRLDNDMTLVSLANYSTLEATVSIYKGLSADGLVREWRTTRTPNAISWYIADIVVTGSGNCRTFSIHEKDSYSTTYNQPATTKSTISNVLQECATSSSCNSLVYGDNAVTRTCGEFGDPHVIMFNGTGVTCGGAGRMTLVDNSYFSLWSDNKLLNTTVLATGFTSVTLRYKVCNPIQITWTISELEPEWIASPASGIHTFRTDQSNFYIDAIHTRIQVRRVGDYLVVGVSTPVALAIGGVCSSGCPAGTEIDIPSVLSSKRDSITKRDVRFKMDVEKALSDCQTAGLTGFELEACTFDLASTGDPNFLDHSTAITEVREAVAGDWNAAPFAPFEEPSGDANVYLPALYMTLIVLIGVALL